MLSKKIFILILLLICFLPYESASATKYSNELCQEEGFTCLLIKKGDSWKKLFPDPESRDIVMRINRMNTPLQKNMHIAVPDELETASIDDYSPFEPEISPPGKKTIFVDYKELAWGAYSPEGELVKWGPVSMGKSYCSDVKRGCRTVTGKFTIYDKRGAGCFSSKYPLPKGGAPMPYCMFFYKGYALHGSPAVPGYHASHGCIRMFVDDARWMNEEFIEPGTQVIVTH